MSNENAIICFTSSNDGLTRFALSLNLAIYFLRSKGYAGGFIY